MAIQFIKPIPEDKLLFAYNNNIIRCYSDSALIPTTAEIVGLNVDIILYPKPDGSFYFNFKEYVSAIINTDNFKDDLDTNTIRWGYEWTNKIYYDHEIVIKINFLGGTYETNNLYPKWLSSYCELDDIETISSENPFVLAPKNYDELPALKFWQGYPFDFTFYNPNHNGLDIINVQDYETGVGLEDYLFTRIVITNGLDVIPNIIQDGISNLVLNRNGLGNFMLKLEKIIVNCSDKVYIKWINRYGGWNYWLFNRGKKSITPKGLGEVNNDFENVQDTISPSVNIGVISKKSIDAYIDISENDMLVMSDLFDSAKVYLFTGEPNTVNNFNNWLEINVKDKTVKIQDAKYDFINVQLELDLPIRVTRTI